MKREVLLSAAARDWVSECLHGQSWQGMHSALPLSSVPTILFATMTWGESKLGPLVTATLDPDSGWRG